MSLLPELASWGTDIACHADCYTQHCGGCKLIQPALSRVAADDEFRGKVTFAKACTIDPIYLSTHIG